MDFPRRTMYGAADRGTRTLEERVRAGLRTAQLQRHSEHHLTDKHLHRQFPKTGLPKLLGKRSSIKKCTWNITPVLPPVRLFIGTIASRPYCV